MSNSLTTFEFFDNCPQASGYHVEMLRSLSKILELSLPRLGQINIMVHWEHKQRQAESPVLEAKVMGTAPSGLLDDTKLSDVSSPIISSINKIVEKGSDIVNRNLRLSLVEVGVESFSTTSLEATTDSIPLADLTRDHLGDDLPSVSLDISNDTVFKANHLDTSPQSCPSPIESINHPSHHDDCKVVHIESMELKKSHSMHISNLLNDGTSHAGSVDSPSVSQTDDMSYPLQSMDVNLPSSQNRNRRRHLTKRILAAMMAMNLFTLIADSVWRKDKGDQMLGGVPAKERDALDLAGKFPLARLLGQFGVTPKQLVIDTAQAGGVCENADGFITKTREYLEIKGSCAKKRNDRIPGPNARPQFSVQGLNFASWWNKLVIVGREQNPADWTSVAEYGRCGFWLGIATQQRCEEALRRKGLPLQGTYDVTVSPWTRETRHVRHGSWLSPCVEWIRFEDLTREWLQQHLGLF